MNLKALLCALFLAPAVLRAGNGFFVQVNVQSQVDANGLGADACRYAGVTLLREGFMGEAAYQVAGMYPGDLSRIFTRPGQGSFALTDVGNQWTHGLIQNQVILAFLETQPGLHGWNGAAYAGASSQSLTKPDIIRGKLEMPGVLMTRLPQPSLLDADSGFIHLQIPGSVDPSGLGAGLRLWRRQADIPGDPWQSVADLPWSSTPQELTDTAVMAALPYIYGLSFSYVWTGGGGAGSDLNVSDRYITEAKGLSTEIYSMKIQPTPTPFPTLAVPTPSLEGEPWVAYPNPLIGSDLYLAFKTEKPKAQYRLSIYSLDGTLVLSEQGEAGDSGWQKPLINLKKLASGVYLCRLRILEPGVDERVLPVRKLALIK